MHTEKPCFVQRVHEHFVRDSCSSVKSSKSATPSALHFIKLTIVAYVPASWLSYVVVKSG